MSNQRSHGGYHSPALEPQLVDMSTCVDAFGIFPPVMNALSRVNDAALYSAYPDPEASHARKIIAAVCRTNPSEVDVGPGAAEIIWTLVRTCVSAGTRVLIWEPCFSEFAQAARAASAIVISHRDSSNAQLELRIQSFVQALRAHRPEVTYLCAPSTPRGEWLPATLLLNIVNNHHDTLFVIDQSYLNMSSHAAELDLRFPSNAVLLRSITKELGIPGVRAGYALMSKDLRNKLNNQRPYWSLGAHAQAVLQAYAECQPFIAERRSFMLEQAALLSAELMRTGWQPELLDTPYFTVCPPSGSTLTARDVAASLLGSHALAVRDCTSFGLPRHVRVVAHPNQNRLVCALSAVAS